MIINARTNKTHFDFNWGRGRAFDAPMTEETVEAVNQQSVGVSVQQLDAALAVVTPYLKGGF